jgi:hypothetical protein
VDRRGFAPRFPTCEAGVLLLDEQPNSSSGDDGNRTHPSLFARQTRRPLVHAPPQANSDKGPPGDRTRSSSLPKRRAAATPADQPRGTFGVGGRQSARAPGLSLPPTADVPPDSSRGGNRTHNHFTRLSTWPLCLFAYSAVRQSRAQVTLLACGGYEPPPGTGPPGKTVTRVGVEPTTHQGLSLAALPVCVPRRPISAPYGDRTHLRPVDGRTATPVASRGKSPLRAVAQVGVEPTAFEVLNPDGLPIAYRAMFRPVPGEGVEPPGARV